MKIIDFTAALEAKKRRDALKFIYEELGATTPLGQDLLKNNLRFEPLMDATPRH